MKTKKSIYHRTFAFAYMLLVAIIFYGCEKVDSNRVQKEILESEFASGISIMTIDSCEYVWVKRGYGGGLSHKGNCKFCVKRSEK
jgi:hypothetical protein